MIRPATKIGLEIIAGLLAIALVLAGLAAWRLSRGPVEIAFVTTAVEDAISDRLGAYSADIGRMAIVWTREDGALELKALDVAILGPDGRVVARVPGLITDFRIDAALAGRLVPRRLVFDQPSLSLVRRADGSLRFGLTGMASPADAHGQASNRPARAAAGQGDKAATASGAADTPSEDPGADDPVAVDPGGAEPVPADPVLAGLLDALSGPADGPEGLKGSDGMDGAAGEAAGLETISIRDAAITVFDQRSEGLWLAPEVDLEFRRTPRGLAGMVRAHVLSPGGAWDLVGTVRSTGSGGRLVLSAEVNDITLADFSRTLVVLDPLSMVEARVSGRVTAEFARAEFQREGLRLAALSVDLAAGPGTLHLPVEMPAPYVPPPPLDYDGKPVAGDPPPPWTPRPWTYALDGARVAGRVSWPDGAFVLEELRLDGPGLALSLRGSGRAVATPEAGIERLELHVIAGPAAIDVPNVTEGLARIDGADLALSIAPETGTLGVRSATINLGEGYITLKGEVAGLAVAAPVAARLDGTLETLALADILQVWPPRVGYGARKWVAANVSGGVIDRGSVRIAAGPGDFARVPLPDAAVALDLDFAGMTIRYLGDMPPITQAAGSIALTGNSFEARVHSGTVAPARGGLIGISEGRFTTRDFHIRGNDGHIRLKAAGSMTAILSLIDEPPLGYAGAFGIDPEAVGGRGQLAIGTRLPLRNRLRFADVHLDVTGRVEDLSLPPLEGGLSLTNGRMDVSVTNDRLHSTGSVDVAGVPVALTWTEDFNARGEPGSTFDLAATLDAAARARLGLTALDAALAGPVPVTARLRGRGPEITGGEVAADLSRAAVTLPWTGWRKEAGIPARATARFEVDGAGAVAVPDFAVTGQGLEIAGAARFGAGGNLLQAEIPRLRWAGQADLAVAAALLDGGGGLRIDVTGRYADGRGVIDRWLWSAGQPAGEEDAAQEGDMAPVVVAARLDAFAAHGGETIADADFFLESAPGGTRQLVVNGRFASGGELTAEVLPTTYGTRSVRAHAEDAGALLRAIDVYPNFEGGVLDFEGLADDRAPGAPVTGRLTGSNLRLKNAPVIANLLSLGSLTGISDQLEGEGILFTRLEAPIRISPHAIDIEEAILAGPALGATLKGHVDRRSDRLDLGGTIVPAYTLNSFFGNIPVLGDIIVGREGEGIFGITYAIIGPADTPEIIVNPLSAFVPGIFRRIFEMGGSPSAPAAEMASGGDAAAKPAPRPEAPSVARPRPETTPAVPPAPVMDNPPATDEPATQEGG